MSTFSYHNDVTVTAVSETQVVIKNCTPFAKCMAKIDGKTIDDAENFDLVMPRYNYSEATEAYRFILNMRQLILIQILHILITLNLSGIKLKKN